MLLELQSGKKAVGRKQSQRAIQDGKARKLFLAEDADASIRQEMQELCQTRGVEVALVPTMAELGRSCGIQVGAAAAALLEK